MDLDCGKLVGMLSTDMSKAFDSLYSPLLIKKKLESYRFSDKALELVRSYFHNRQNRVKLASMLSQWRVLKRGCPQGSCFGPLFGISTKMTRITTLQIGISQFMLMTTRYLYRA